VDEPFNCTIGLVQVIESDTLADMFAGGVKSLRTVTFAIAVQPFEDFVTVKVYDPD
jgi:hypothetical protein